MANLLLTVGLVLFAVLIVIPLIATKFLRNVEAGEIRMVSWLQGSTVTYRGPGKSKEIPLLTTGTTISSKAINVDLDITDQTADVDQNGVPQPIKVRVQASAIVSVGDSEEMIKTAANRFFAKGDDERMATLIDLLSSSGRRAINLLTHDQLFSAKTAQRTESASTALVVAGDDDDDPLAIIIRKACSRELTDLGLGFNSLNIKVVQSEVAEARRRQSAAEARANAEIVEAQQARRAREAALEADREISNKERELAETRAANAAKIAEAEVKRQEALAFQRRAELAATQTAQAQADADRMRIQAQAEADSEAIRVVRVAAAHAESIDKVSTAVRAGGESYLRYRQIEMLPELAPKIAEALAQAKMITISGDGQDAGSATTAQISGVLQTVLATQIVSQSGLLDTAQAKREEAVLLPVPPTR
jgi:flotillin